MLEILLFCISIMYTPGPMNVLGLHAGLQKRFFASKGFFLGTGLAAFLLFLGFAYVGAAFLNPTFVNVLGLLGSGYILFLAYKIFFSSVNLEEKKEVTLDFKTGFVMPFLNPKSPLVILPITTVQFPNNEIVGVQMVLMCALIGTLAMGAPTLYAFLGERFSTLVKQKSFFTLVNKAMALVLVYLGADIFLSSYLAFNQL